MSITIKDVAREVGVSLGTVSNVLNGRNAQYNEETYQRVMQVVRELDYHPNRHARSLARRTAQVIGVSFAEQERSLSGNPYVADILDGMMQSASENGYNLTLFTCLPSGKESRYLTQFLDRSIDGLCLIAPALLNPLPKDLLLTHLPAIVVGADYPETAISWIDVNNEEGARVAMEYLVEHGHTRIAHLAGEPVQRSALLRHSGYCSILAKYNLTNDPSFVHWCDYDKEKGYHYAKHLLKRSDRPTALFAADDLIALGALDAARELGLRVPEEVSVIGFDDIPKAQDAHPPLTTIRQPMREIGMRAAEWLIKQAAVKRVEPLQLLIKPSLVERGSVARV